MLVFCWLSTNPACIIPCCTGIVFCWYGIPIMPAGIPMTICCCGTPTTPGCIPYTSGCRCMPIMPGCMPINGPELNGAPEGTPIIPGMAPGIIAGGLPGCSAIMPGAMLAMLTGWGCVEPKQQKKTISLPYNEYTKKVLKNFKNSTVSSFKSLKRITHCRKMKLAACALCNS